MSSRFFSYARARAVAVALGAGVLGSLATAPPGLAAAPKTGANCVASDGKITGRGASFQTWLQYDLNGAFASDVCGSTFSSASNDFTHPDSPLNTVGTGTYQHDWMVAYNYPSAQSNGATGSGAGLSAISCRAEAYGASDIPYTRAQQQTIDALSPVQVGSKPCLPNSSFTQMFTPLNNSTNPAPALGDAGGASNAGNVPGNGLAVPVGAGAVDVAANFTGFAATQGCSPSGTFALSTADMAGIWGGTFTNWGQVVAQDYGNPTTNTTGIPLFADGLPFTYNAGTMTLTTPCSNVPIVRVVRWDNSGTTQNIDNYFATALATLSPAIATCTPGAQGSSTVATYADMKSSQYTAPGNTDVNWPGGPAPQASSSTPFPTTLANTLVSGDSCSAVVPGGDTYTQNASPTDHYGSWTGTGSSGNNNNMHTLDSIPGGISYADLSDEQKDPGDFGTLTAAAVQPSTGGAGVSASQASGASNCTLANATLPSGNGAVGYTNSTVQQWALDSTASRSDMSWTKQGSAWPICAITWDLFFSNENGNTPPTPTASALATLPASTIGVSSLAGLPSELGSAQQSFTVTDSAGTENLNYTGLGKTAAACGTVTPPCLTGVTGGTATATIASGATLTWPLGTGGPEANLTPDQRRTLYSYFTYLMSDAAQSTEAAAGYHALPASWLTTLRTDFQTLF